MFYNNIHTRIRYVFLVVTIILIIAIARVFYIQVFSYKKLNTLAESLWSRKLPISADRGKIIDRKGRELATNITTTSLVVIPNQIKDKEKTAASLSNILKSDYKDMLKHVSKKTSIERVHPEGRGLSYDIAEAIDSLKLDGVYLVKESKRYYPYDNLLSHVLGYVGIDNQGLSGLELYYDKYLTGSNGSIKYFSDGKGRKLELSEIYEAPTSGITLQLSIDLDLQLAMENELDNVVAKYNPNSVIALAMNPNTGEILASSARPNFNSNNYKAYNVEVINRNLPIWMTFEPGSTMKITTYTAAINEGLVNIFEDKFTDTGKINVDGATLHCWKRGGHGLQTYLEVIENSCNTGFVSLGLMLQKEKLMEYIKELGFGKKTGIDLNGESTGILFDINKMGNVELATTAFGQGISVTPIQQVRAVSAIVNGGTLYTPYIVKNFLEPETNTIIKSISPKSTKNIIKKETSELVKYALESVVAKGSGHNAYIENYRIGGKTGTAQTVENGVYSNSKYILSFIGFMPADNPEIVLYIAVDNPKNVVQYGGVVAAPIAKNIFLSAIDILDIKQSNEGIAKEYTWLDQKYVQVPDVVGKTVDEAKSLLKGFSIEYSGNGNKVIYTSPKSGTYTKEFGTIVLMLN